MNPLVSFFSIIIPVFNGGLTLRKCLNSIVSQSFTEIEVLIIDSLSDDETSEIVSEYQKQFAFIRHIREKDRGVYDGMNRGIREARGKYLYFMGSDDLLFSNTILTTVAEHINKANEPDIIYGNVLLGESNLVHNGVYSLCKIYDVNICHQSIFYNQNVFRSGLLYDLNYPALADWHLNFKCFTNKSIRIVYSNMLVCKFNLGGLSSTLKDPLHEIKKTLFMSFAKNYFKDDYYKLKRYSTESDTFFGKIMILYFHALYTMCYVYRKVFSN